MNIARKARGQFALTNLQVAGQLASDQTYIILALRCWLYFRGMNMINNYYRTASQLYFTLELGDKPAFAAPCWYFPSGGGIWGSGGATTGDTTAATFMNLGEASQAAILKLGRPIMVPVRQNFAVSAQWFTVGSTNGLTGLNSGATEDEKVIMFVIDGLQTRDVQ